MHKLLLSAFLLLTLFAVGCTPDPDPEPSTKSNIKFKVNVTAGDATFRQNEAYTMPDGLEYSFDVLKFYLSDLKLVKQDGSTVLMKDLLFIDTDTKIAEPYDRNSVGREFTFEVESGSYKSLELSVGVPKERNVVNNDYPNDHPLSLYRGTDWSWAGYRFIMAEGLARNGNSGNRTGFSYHILTDSFFQTLRFDKNIDITAGNTHDLVVNVDISKLFRPTDAAQKIDPVTEPITHTEGTEEKINLARKLNANFGKAISL